jgi:AAA family ATP:ADP antiporter
VRLFAAIRPPERRDTWAAFSTLFGLIGSHSILETARDALFLAKVPATRLPWVYLAIAVVSLGVGRVQARLGAGLPPRTSVAVWTLVAAVVTLVFWALIEPLGAAGLYALYVWSGVLISLVLVHFWALLANIFSVTQAKRVYGLIGAGSVLGAIAGSAAASALARVLPPARLVVISAAGFALTAALPALFREAGTPRAGGAAPATGELLDDARWVVRQPYAARVAWILVVSAACLTVADYAFKSTVAAHVPREQLGAWLGTFYLVLNVLSLGAQLFVVPWILRRFDLAMALAVLPALLALGGVGLALGGALAAAVLVKGADGALRYSLHRTSTELLFVPLADEARRRMKAVIDVLGQRAGQAVASVAILLMGALVLPRWMVAAGLSLLAIAWGAGALGLRRHYLDLFRRHLREGRLSHLTEFPGLDVASLETLVAALDSQNDAEVLAALDVLQREGKARLVPALILYHPSDEVVVRALAFFAQVGRKNVVPVIDRLLEHDSARVRAAAVAARSVLLPDARLLNLRLSMEDSPEVRATIVVQLIAAGEILGAEAKDRLETLLARGSAATRVALAEAIALRGARGFTDVLARLAVAAESDVRLAAAQAMARLRAPEMVASLVLLLGDERTRPAARTALAGFGDEGAAAVEQAFADESLPHNVRWQLPRAMALFDPQRAARVLLERLNVERDGMVRYRVVRALEGLVARSPEVSLDRDLLRRAIESTVSRAYRYLDRRLTMIEGAQADPKRATPGHGLLVRILRDKEQNAIGRLLRLLGLAFPAEDFSQIARGLRSKDKGARASSVELIENLIEPPLRGAVMGLVDDAPDAERLAASGKFHRPLRLEYEPLLARMLDSESESLQDLTVYHVGELRLGNLRERVEALPRERSDVARTLELLDGRDRGADAEVAC